MFEKCSITVEHSQCVATKIEFGQSVIRPYPSNESEESFHSRWMYIHLEGRTENGMKAGASNPTGWKMKRKKQKQRCTCDALLLHHRGGYSLERGISASFFCARNFKALQITFTCHSCWIRASTRQKRIFLPPSRPILPRDFVS